jgi:hypothetical protein
MARGACTGAQPVSATGETIAHPLAMAVDVEVRIMHGCAHECELSGIHLPEIQVYSAKNLRCGCLEAILVMGTAES